MDFLKHISLIGAALLLMSDKGGSAKQDDELEEEIQPQSSIGARKKNQWMIEDVLELY